MGRGQGEGIFRPHLFAFVPPAFKISNMKFANPQLLPRTIPLRSAANTLDKDAVPVPVGHRSPFMRTKNCRGQGVRNNKTFNDLFRR
jgi:hypothetical protein